MNAIEINGLTKSYDDFKLDSITMNIPKGSIVGLVGENGAGKTTTINLIMDAIKRDSGSVKVLGIDNKDKRFTRLKNDIGIVLDEAYYPEILNANDVNRIMKHTYYNWDERIYYEYINRFHLPTNKKFKDYSRGMKMKLAISVAMSHNAKLLILDEATSGLDPMVRDEVLQIFNEFTRDEEKTVLLSSHIVSDLEKICDYIAFIHKGRLIFMEEKDRVLNDYSLINISKDSVLDIPDEAIVGVRENKYSTELLVKKELVNKSFKSEHFTLEDIILFMAKEAE
jgi:ABC-2 type transport system ATP-binding protein